MKLIDQSQSPLNILEQVGQDHEGPIKGYVHSVESFGSVDGPGIRFVVFMQGCRMRCQYCHNPDTWNIGVGEEMTADQILADAQRYKAFWGEQGGITCSGGESLVQIDFILELFTKATYLCQNEPTLILISNAWEIILPLWINAWSRKWKFFRTIR